METLVNICRILIEVLHNSIKFAFTEGDNDYCVTLENSYYVERGVL